MSFKRKFWKRGDKLNAKELNRIEEGIVNSNGSSNSSNEIIKVEFLSDGEGGWDTFADFNETLSAIKDGKIVNCFASQYNGSNIEELWPLQLINLTDTQISFVQNYIDRNIQSLKRSNVFVWDVSGVTTHLLEKPNTKTIYFSRSIDTSNIEPPIEIVTDTTYQTAIQFAENGFQLFAEVSMPGPGCVILPMVGVGSLTENSGKTMMFSTITYDTPNSPTSFNFEWNPNNDKILMNIN